MKKVKLLTVTVPPGYARDGAQQLGIVKADGTMNSADWLSGTNNPWGLHQDLRFATNLGAVRQGLRIMEATEKAVAAGASEVELIDEDHAVLLEVLKSPQKPNGLAICPTDLMRSALPIFEAIETATA